jgi:hypothetical protein
MSALVPRRAGTAPPDVSAGTPKGGAAPSMERRDSRQDVSGALHRRTAHPACGTGPLNPGAAPFNGRCGRCRVDHHTLQGARHFLSMCALLPGGATMVPTMSAELRRSSVRARPDAGAPSSSVHAGSPWCRRHALRRPRCSPQRRRGSANGRRSRSVIPQRFMKGPRSSLQVSTRSLRRPHCAGQRPHTAPGWSPAGDKSAHALRERPRVSSKGVSRPAAGPASRCDAGPARPIAPESVPAPPAR